MRRHPRLLALVGWLVMAAISVAGFAAYRSDPDPAAAPTTTSSTAFVADPVGIVGGVGRAVATLPPTTP